MEKKIELTPDERRLIAVAYQRYLATVQAIADLRGLSGNISVAPDQSGFICQE